MEKVINKRSELMNFFKNENKTYTKQEILHREFAVLSFSPREEYIDTIVTEFDDYCVDLDTFKFEDTDECYIKGIISDVDRQRYQLIIHLQNKDHNISITIRDSVANIYNNYLVVGEPCIVKCRIWRERLYLSFLIALNHIDDFPQECDYIKGILFDLVKEKNDGEENKTIHYGIIKQCPMVTTKKGKKMLRGTLYEGPNNERSFGCMMNIYNRQLSPSVHASDCIQFKSNHEFFISDARLVKL